MSLTPVAIQATRSVACATVVWTTRRHTRVTAILKATFTLVPGGTMTLAAPLPVEATEAHHGGNPGRSVRTVGELAPHLPAVDVTLIGHAFAPRGRAVPRSIARLGLFRERERLLDKSIHVVGSRRGDEVVPFERMALTYELAYGGIGYRDNPLGTGFSGARQSPNLVDPNAPDRVACFAPISRAWPARKLLLGHEMRRAVERPTPEITEGFDWGYFQAAPPDQRIESLLGGEILLLGGMSPDYPELVSRIPRLEAKARFRGLTLGGAEDGGPLALRADSLWIDADAGRCTVTFRASVAVSEPAALSRLRVEVALGLDGATLDWPAPSSPSPEADGREGAPLSGRFERTVALVDYEAPRPRVRREITLAQDPDLLPEAPLPFQPAPTRGGPKQGPLAPIPGAPWGVPAKPIPAIARGSEGFDTLPADLPLPASCLETLDGGPPPGEVPTPAPAVSPEPPPWVVSSSSAPSPEPPGMAPSAQASSAPVLPAQTPLPAPEPAPARDPYGQAAPWAAGPRESAAAEASAPPAPKVPAKPKADIYKKFGRR